MNRSHSSCVSSINTSRLLELKGEALLSGDNFASRSLNRILAASCRDFNWLDMCWNMSLILTLSWLVHRVYRKQRANIAGSSHNNRWSLGLVYMATSVAWADAPLSAASKQNFCLHLLRHTNILTYTKADDCFLGISMVLYFAVDWSLL